MCDTFYYRYHKFSGVFDPDTHAHCDNMATSGAESINKMWAASIRHIQFLSGENLIPFVFLWALLLSIRAHILDNKGVSDVEDFNIVEFCNSLMPCECGRCRTE